LDFAGLSLGKVLFYCYDYLSPLSPSTVGGMSINLFKGGFLMMLYAQNGRNLGPPASANFNVDTNKKTKIAAIASLAAGK
jgi:hypothetical protein